jgi:hypothetical protein
MHPTTFFLHARRPQQQAANHPNGFTHQTRSNQPNGLTHHTQIPQRCSHIIPKTRRPPPHPGPVLHDLGPAVDLQVCHPRAVQRRARPHLCHKRHAPVSDSTSSGRGEQPYQRCFLIRILIKRASSLIKIPLGRTITHLFRSEVEHGRDAKTGQPPPIARRCHVVSP